MNQGAWGGGSSSELGLAATPEHGSSPCGGRTERGEHGDPSSGLTGARVAVERRRNGGDERRGLELSVRATEGLRELNREGKRGGEGVGYSSPFIGPGGRRWWPG
jgi:hypothetical protein